MVPACYFPLNIGDIESFWIVDKVGIFMHSNWHLEIIV